MKRKAWTLLLALLLCLSLCPAATAAGVGTLPEAWTAPTNVTVTNETEGGGQFNLMVSFIVGADHSAFADDIEYQGDYAKYGLTDAVSYHTDMQIDWRVDGGAWHYDSAWDRGEDSREGADVWLYYRGFAPYGNERAGSCYILWLPTAEDYENNYEGWRDAMAAAGVSDLTASDEGNMQLNLDRHLVEVRVRMLTMVWGPDVDAAYGEENASHYILSPWSATAAIGRGAAAVARPERLPVPAVTSFTVSAAKDSGLVPDGYPIFTYQLTVPPEVEKLAADANALWAQFVGDVQVKVGDGDWQNILNDGGWDDIEITSGQHTGYMPGLSEGDYTAVLGGESQMRVRYTWTDDGPALASDWCAPLRFGSAAWQSSAWAKEELKKADELGLIPASLADADLKQDITRAEFAAVAVKVYENLSGVAAIPAVTNPFTDTADVEVLKAYNVGITDGTGATTFAPDQLLNREQAATMLTRVFKKVSMPGWTLKTDGDYSLSYDKPAAFADDKDISGWAKDSVYFMAANGIVGGVGDNKFAPKNITSEEQARGYANATREQALVIAVRMVSNLSA